MSGKYTGKVYFKESQIMVTIEVEAQFAPFVPRVDLIEQAIRDVIDGTPAPPQPAPTALSDAKDALIFHLRQFLASEEGAHSCLWTILGEAEKTLATLEEKGENEPAIPHNRGEAWGNPTKRAVIQNLDDRLKEAGKVMEQIVGRLAALHAEYEGHDHLSHVAHEASQQCRTSKPISPARAGGDSIK